MGHFGLMLHTESREGAERSLSIVRSPHRQPRVVLEKLLAYLQPDVPAYGADGPLQTLQDRVAEMLGKESALFLPTGKMAQQIALRLHAEATGRRIFAAHPTCHLVLYENDGFAEVHNLRYRPLGDQHQLFEANDIRALWEPVAAVLWELPQRELGGINPDWDAVLEQVAAARELGARTHLDGARLWEAQTFYERSFAELAAPFDSVYVSLYKTIGAPRGALLAGNADFIARANHWAIRLGGESNGNWPLAAAALMALDETLPRMTAYRDRAVELAGLINSAGIARTVPTVPQTPMFFVRLPIPARAAVDAHVELCRESGLELFRLVRLSDDPDACSFEISIGEGAMAIDPNDVVDVLTRLVERGRTTQAAA
jgi:threonine aldolase